MIIFGGVVFFFKKFWNFYTKSNIFNILSKMFMFYCQQPFNHELSVFIYVIVMDKSMFWTLSWIFRLTFGLLLKFGATKNRKLQIILHKNLIFGENH